ncbi:hypothetical protein WJU23_03230 [Prosthecobacter sp. SYSU 5D2]|uniref:hypothetical protein n=1 Tax=Prosthecobacter sp. SYSU 5D2 TaxID=3134134 RepID=UPI0031FF36E6
MNKYRLLALSLIITTFGQATEVIVDRADSKIFPEAWLNPKTNPSAQLLPESDQARCRALILQALAAYPSEVLEENLKKVHVVGSLRYSGVSTGGTNSRGTVYVVSNEKYTTAQFERIFHAEFSSILFRNHARHFDPAAWQQLNPQGFVYGGSGVKAVKAKKASTRINPGLHPEGFLHSYGTASIEEDFNSFAALLFMGDPAFWSAIENYPKIKAKAGHVAAFYQKIHPSFTLDFFKSRRR